MKGDFKRVEIYREHVVISDGNIFMMFHSSLRYKSLDEIRLAIDKIEHFREWPGNKKEEINDKSKS